MGGMENASQAERSGGIGASVGVVRAMKLESGAPCGVETQVIEDSWIAVMLEQRIRSRGHDLLMDSLPEDQARRRVRDMTGKTARAMSTPAKFLEGLAAASAPTNVGGAAR